MSVHYWFEAVEDDEVAKRLIGTAKAIASEQASREGDYRRFASYYKDRTVSSFRPGQWARGAGAIPAPLSYNVIRACINTMVSRITLHQPMARVMTTDAPEVDQQRAQLCEQFVVGALQAAEGFRLSRACFRDACVYGTGVLKVYAGEGRVRIERIHPSRMIVDDEAALDDEPLSIFQTHYLSKPELLALYPKQRAVIEEAKFQMTAGQVSRDLVEVLEGYRVPLGKQKGLHAVALSNGLLLREEWDEPAPYVVSRWSEDLQGWHGIGIAEELEGMQLEINDVLSKVQRNLHLMSVPFFMVHESANVKDDHLLTNLEARKVVYSGNIPPKVETPPGVHPQVFQWLEQLWERSFEIVGISQLSATSQKPGSLRSGLALMTYQDIETIRFSIVANAWQEFHVALYNAVKRAGRRVKNWRVSASGRDFLKRLSWEDVAIDEDQFTIQVYPQSSLPLQPAGRQQKIVEYVQAGILDSNEARQLLSFPDIDKWSRLANSDFDLFERTFEQMLYGDRAEYIEPLTVQDLPMGIKLASRYWARAKLEGVEDERVDNIERWIQEASKHVSPELLPPHLRPPAAAAPAAPPPMAPGAPMPPGLPPQGELAPGMAPPMAPPPINDLIPPA